MAVGTKYYQRQSNPYDEKNVTRWYLVVTIQLEGSECNKCHNMDHKLHCRWPIESNNHQNNTDLQIYQFDARTLHQVNRKCSQQAALYDL